MVSSGATELRSCPEHVDLVVVLKRLLDASFPGSPVPVKLLLLLHALGDRSHAVELSRRLRALALSKTLPPSQFQEANRLYCSNTLKSLQGAQILWHEQFAHPIAFLRAAAAKYRDTFRVWRASAAMALAQPPVSSLP